MGEETIWRCDVCKDTRAVTEDLSDWHRAQLLPLFQTQPGPTGGPLDLLGLQLATAGVKVICHKPSCLTRWAKDKNAERVDAAKALKAGIPQTAEVLPAHLIPPDSPV